MVKTPQRITLNQWHKITVHRVQTKVTLFVDKQSAKKEFPKPFHFNQIDLIGPLTLGHPRVKSQRYGYVHDFKKKWVNILKFSQSKMQDFGKRGLG